MTPSSAPAWVGPLCAFMSSVTWAIGSSSYARLSQKHSAFTVNFVRALFAIPLFVLVVVFTASEPRWTDAYRALQARHAFWLLLSALASYGLGDVIFLGSARAIGVPAALAIASTYPIWATAVSVLFMGRAPQASQWAGLVVAVVGTVGVILHGRRKKDVDVLSHSHWGRGVALAALTSLFWSLNSLSVAQAGHDLHPGVANSVRLGFAMVLGMAFGALFGKGRIPRLSLPRSELKRMAPIFVFEAFGGSYFFLVGLSLSSLAVGVTLSSLAPVLAVPIAVLQGMERFSWGKTFWIAVVVLGVWLLV